VLRRKKEKYLQEKNSELSKERKGKVVWREKIWTNKNEKIKFEKS